MGAVVAHDKVVAGRDSDFAVLWEEGFGAGIDRGVEVFVFIERSVVDIDFSAGDFNFFSGKSDDSFNKVDFGVAGGFEHDDVAALGQAETVTNFVGKNVFSVVEVWLHRVAFDLVGLEEEEVHDDKKGQGKNRGLDEFPENTKEIF